MSRSRLALLYPGNGVCIGKDDTIYAKIAGRVAFERKGRFNRQVSVYAVEDAAM